MKPAQVEGRANWALIARSQKHCLNLTKQRRLPFLQAIARFDTHHWFGGTIYNAEWCGRVSAESYVGGC